MPKNDSYSAVDFSQKIQSLFYYSHCELFLSNNKAKRKREKKPGTDSNTQQSFAVANNADENRLLLTDYKKIFGLNFGFEFKVNSDNRKYVQSAFSNAQE